MRPSRQPCLLAFLLLASSLLAAHLGSSERPLAKCRADAKAGLGSEMVLADPELHLETHGMLRERDCHVAHDGTISASRSGWLTDRILVISPSCTVNVRTNMGRPSRTISTPGDRRTVTGRITTRCAALRRAPAPAWAATFFAPLMSLTPSGSKVRS